MKLNISDKHFIEIIQQGYSLDLIYLLKLLFEGKDISSLCEQHEKIKLMNLTLIRKGLSTEENKITLLGKELLLFIESSPGKNIAKKIKEEISSDFMEWWKTYPATDIFTYKNREFTGSRTLRVKQDDCRIKYESIIGEGDITAKELLDALKLEIYMKKESSVKEGTNKLKYMQNSLTYLNQRTFEGFVELLRNGSTFSEHKSSGGVDI